MRISKKGLDLIKKYEGFRAYAYRDVTGLPTIGYGTTHYVGGRAVTMQDHNIDPTTAEIVLRSEVDAIYGHAVNAFFPDGIEQDKFDALVSFCYNMGVGALKRSTLLKYALAGQWYQAGDEFNKWVHAAGKVQKGLVVRREEERELFLA